MCNRYAVDVHGTGGRGEASAKSQVMREGLCNIWNTHQVTDNNQSGYISATVPLFHPTTHRQSPLTDRCVCACVCACTHLSGNEVVRNEKKRRNAEEMKREKECAAAFENNVPPLLLICPPCMCLCLLHGIITGINKVKRRRRYETS